MKCSAHCNHDWVCLKQSKTGLRSSAPWQTRRAGENATRDEKIKLTLMGHPPPVVLWMLHKLDNQGQISNSSRCRCDCRAPARHSAAGGSIRMRFQ